VLIKVPANKKRKRNQRLKAEEEEKDETEKEQIALRDTYVETLKEGIRRRQSIKEYIYTVDLRSVHYLSTF
jgi:hypothetical protein